ncbi:Methyl-CpG-binding domain protein 2 [Blomia tropicalis]|nr:Methyl-CpG-binding domain protein 2 [Blomia tropicalis]
MSSLSLPDGWRREEIKRPNGLSSGKVEVCYISPSGRKILSKAELAQYLGHNVDLSTFDWNTGRINSALIRKSKRSGKTGLYDYKSLKHDPSLTAPVRRSPFIFKKPVTIIRSQSKSTTLNSQQIRDYNKKACLAISNVKLDSGDKPYQIFWQKRLQGLRASIHDLDSITNFELPSNMKGFLSSFDNDSLLRSVAASLHMNHSTRGQDKHVLQKSKKELVDHDPDRVRNPVAFVNPHQPLFLSTTITEEDIKRQEELVMEARQKLTSFRSAP